MSSPQVHDAEERDGAYLQALVSINDVAHCYEVFLGRSAENEQVVAEKRGQTRLEVLEAFLGSPEFVDIVRHVPLHGDWGNELFRIPMRESSRQWAADFLQLQGSQAEAAKVAGSFLSLLGVYSRDAVICKIIGSVVGNRSAVRLATAASAAGGLIEHAAIADSGVFDVLYYLSQPSDGVESITTVDEAIAHYIASGAAAGVDPGPLFNQAWYLRQRPDANSAGVNPLVHFLTVGGFEGADPHPLFNSEWYTAVVPDVIASGMNPLVHYIKRGGRYGDDPSLLFQSHWYLLANPQARKRGINPLAHFLTSNGQTDPNPLFSCRWYIEQYGDRATADVNALTHYVTEGAAANLRPNPLLLPDWYLHRNPTVAAAGMDALAHYLRYGSHENLDPGPQFDTAWYRAEHDSELEDMLPLEHYLKQGMARGYRGYDPNLPYRRQIDFEQRRAILETPELLQHIDVMIRRPHFLVFTECAAGRRSALERSLAGQIYPDWTLYTADERTALIGRLAHDDSAALVWLESDVLHPQALYHFASALNADPQLEIVYGDEDALDTDEGRANPFFKPDWSPDTLEAFNYIGTAAAYSAPVAQAFFPLSETPYDMVLRATEQPRRVAHVREVILQACSRFDGSPETIASDTRALAARLERTGRSGRIGPLFPDSRCYHFVTAPGSDEGVSIVIPTAGKVIDLDGRRIDLIVNCVDLILSPLRRHQPEIIIVHNGDLGVDRERWLTGRGCRLVKYTDRVFNVARKLNLGAKVAKREQLLLLNDDIEPVSEDWIERMQAQLMKPHVGVVGAKLLYPNFQLQHGGVVTNWGNPDHVSRFAERDDRGYFFSGAAARNFAAVTGACMLTPAALYRRVGGYTELLKISYNDVDYCFKAREQGFSIVYEPDAELIHFESKSRVPSLDPVEAAYLQERWAAVMTSDPFYNEDRFTVAPPTFAVKFNRRF